MRGLFGRRRRLCHPGVYWDLGLLLWLDSNDVRSPDTKRDNEIVRRRLV